VGHTSARHTLKQARDSVALGIRPISPNAIERGYRYARHTPHCATRSLGPTRGNPDDEVLPNHSEGTTRRYGIDSDPETLRAIATMAQLAHPGSRYTTTIRSVSVERG
jgi:hypothetical protein